MAQHKAKLTKRQKRLIRQNNDDFTTEASRPRFELKTILPLTANQRKTFQAFETGKNLFLHGIAGTGKTFISLYLSLNDIMYNDDTVYERIIIIRSVVPTRDMGFLPGSQMEKMKVYEAPYYAICEELFDRKDAYDVLKKNRMTVDFMSTSFVRGTTLRNAIVVVDEVQNMTAQELHSVITRAGHGCRMIFCGDMKQNDLLNNREFSGLSDFMKIIKRMNSFEFVEFGIDDITRSELVKSYIIARNNLEDCGAISAIA